MRLEPLCSESLWLCLSPRVPLSSALSLSFSPFLSVCPPRPCALGLPLGGQVAATRGTLFPPAVHIGVSELPRSWVFVLYFVPTVHSLGAKKKILKVAFTLTSHRGVYSWTLAE